MLRSFEATVETDGTVRIQEPVCLAHPSRAIVTVIEDHGVSEVTFLSEAALAVDWDRSEEDEAWSHLQQDQ